MRQLWREHVLGQYLRGTITREEAIASVGMDWVELAEQQNETMREDYPDGRVLVIFLDVIDVERIFTGVIETL